MNKNIHFVHISKTGGETIEILLKIKKSHELAKNIDLTNKYSFSFVRNPYSRLYSWYNHFRKHLYMDEINKNMNILNEQSQSYNSLKKCNMVYPKPHRNLAVKYEFKDWVKIILFDDKYKNPSWGPCGLQCDYIYDNDVLLINDIYRFEKYEDNIKKLFIKIGRNDLIDKINKANYNIYKIPIQNAYDEELIDIVYKYFQKDFEIFDYDKNSFV